MLKKYKVRLEVELEVFGEELAIDKVKELAKDWEGDGFYTTAYTLEQTSSKILAIDVA